MKGSPLYSSLERLHFLVLISSVQESHSGAGGCTEKGDEYSEGSGT